ncbi:MAG: hypothetical protein KAH18_11095 [Psychromonas sp.]|nr:hypothetical protein [Psychromonas sp.]
MSTVLFGYFGAKSHQQSEFTAKEKNLLTLAVAGAEEHLFKAMQACFRNFEEDLDDIYKWFGDISKEFIIYLKKMIYQLHSIFTDPEIFIKFIDARGQYYHPYPWRLPIDGIPDLRYNELVLEGGKRTRVDDCTNGFVYPLSWQDLNSKLFSHAGSVINIYIADNCFEPSYSCKERARFILHEVSHKAISTVDYRLIPINAHRIESFMVTDEIDCLCLAITDPDDAKRNAQCWAYFLWCF